MLTPSAGQAAPLIARALHDAYDHCEEIAKRDKPHLYAAAQRFVFPETRRAFASAYASMRVIDDYVDGIPDRARLAGSARQDAVARVDGWLVNVEQAANNGTVNGPLWRALSDTFSNFAIPLDPWRNLAAAMRSDLFTPRFSDWPHLKQYMTGASIAPAIVFMHLVLMHPAGDGRFACPWGYEQVESATADLAIFCYWTHILRDVAIDLDAVDGGLIYIPVADLDRFGLPVRELREMRQEGKTSEPYRRLAAFEAGRARRHLSAGKRNLPSICSAAPEGNDAALRYLVETYETVLDDLESSGFDVFSKTNPSGRSVVRERV
ncbi:MAG TPA: squalene/phytoene synthase family protein [candidate division Zixibacteria bacterium]|jgi:phytoene synthase